MSRDRGKPSRRPREDSVPLRTPGEQQGIGGVDVSFHVKVPETADWSQRGDVGVECTEGDSSETVWVRRN